MYKIRTIYIKMFRQYHTIHKYSIKALSSNINFQRDTQTPEY